MVEINYANGETATLRLANPDHQLQNLLLGDNKRDVVLFGEGNFTFTVALATLRGSYAGIVSTRFENEYEKPVPSFSDVKLEAIENTRLHANQDVLRRIQVPEREIRRFGVDATDLPVGLEVGGKVVWFQCPWTTQDDTDELLRNVLEEMGRKQNQHDYLLIGIANLFPYVKSYCLQAIFGDNLQNRRYRNYHFIGCDTEFIKDILKFGYRHTGIRDIHFEIMNHHVTLIFQKVP